MPSILMPKVEKPEELVKRLREEPEMVYKESKLVMSDDFNNGADMIRETFILIGRCLMGMFVGIFGMFGIIFTSFESVIQAAIWPITKRAYFNKAKDRILDNETEFIEQSNRKIAETKNEE